jgi:DNA-binding transcriptional MerR regulator
MLRYYDEVGLLKPAHIDRFTGYRNYSVEQIPLLQKIVMLRDLGYSVAEIAVAIENWKEDFLTANLAAKRLEIFETIKSEESRLARIDAAIAGVGKAEIARHYNYTIKKIPAYQVLSLRRIIPDYFAEATLWGEMFEYIDKHRVAIVNNADNFAIYHDEGYQEADVDVEVCVVVGRKGKTSDGFVFNQTDAVECMACTLVYGPFANIAGAYLSFAEWLAGHSVYKMSNPCRQICHRGPWNEKNEDLYLTEIQIPLEKS